MQNLEIQTCTDAKKTKSKNKIKTICTSKPKFIDFAPLIDRIKRRLPSTSVYLNQGQRLTMVNYILSALPTYYMCTLKIPKKVI